MDSVLLELCAPFDIIDHNILIDRLRHWVGIPEILLGNRQVYVFKENHLSLFFFCQNLVWRASKSNFGPIVAIYAPTRPNYCVHC